MSKSSTTVILITFKWVSDNQGRLLPLSAQTGAVLLYHPFGCSQNWNDENGYIMLLFLRWSSSCWVGVEVKLKLESVSIFLSRTRNRIRSRLKFIDSAAVILIIALMGTGCWGPLLRFIEDGEKTAALRATAFCIPYQVSFSPFPEKIAPGSSQVRSPRGQAKWPYLLKSLWYKIQFLKDQYESFRLSYDHQCLRVVYLGSYIFVT